MLSLVNENRVNAVISKIGEITNKDFGKILGLLNKDVFDEFNKDFKDKFESLDIEEQKKIKSVLNKESASVVRKISVKII